MKREDFPILENKNLIYFDNNSTCELGPKFKEKVMEEVKKNGIIK